MEDNVKILTPTGNTVSFHISEIELINVTNGDYISAIKTGTLIKNDTVDLTDPNNPIPKSVLLEVKLINDDNFVSTYFAPGWNPEIVKEIKQSSIEGINLKRGY